MSSYCDHVWATYNSGWTMYQFCTKCGIKKDDQQTPDQPLLPGFDQALFDEISKQIEELSRDQKT